MSTEIFESVTDLCETAIENYKKIGKSCLEVTEQLLQEQVDLIESMSDTAKSRANKAASTKDAATLVANQAELAQEISQQILKTSQSCAAIVAEAGKFYQSLIESGMKSANGNFGAAVKTASAGKKTKAQYPLPVFMRQTFVIDQLNIMF